MNAVSADLRDDALRKLRRAFAGLNEDQGRVARGNARRKVLLTLSQIRRLVDAEFPSIGRKNVRRASVDPKARERRLAKRGFVQCGSDTLDLCALAGIKCEWIQYDVVARSFCPGWVLSIRAAYGANPLLPKTKTALVAKLKRAKRSKMQREALMAEVRLTTGRAP